MPALGPWVVLTVMAGLVVSPFVLVLVNSFAEAGPGDRVVYGLGTWQVALRDPGIVAALWNTLQLTLVTQAIAMAVAIPCAWLLARTDLPHASRLEFMLWIAFFLPGLPVLLGWLVLLDPQAGLLNQLTKAVPFIGRPVFDMYSFWGIVWAHLGHETIAVKVILLAPAFRNLDASLEEAAGMSGANRLETVLRVVIPLTVPAIGVVLVLSIIRSLQNFEVESILGTRVNLFVFSTKIYALIRDKEPLYGQATVLASVILGMILPLVLAQHWIVSRRHYATLGSHFRGTRIRLGVWRTPAFLLLLGLVLTTTVIPLSMLVISSVMKLFGFFAIKDPWTLVHWSEVFGDGIFLQALRNTFVLALSVALLGAVLFTIVAYICVRTRFRARGVLDVLAWLPSTLPGIILSLGLLWMILGNPALRWAYGTVVAMILGVLIAYMTLGIQTLKAAMVQLGTDLEEAARVNGGTWVHTMRRIIVPLIAPQLFLVIAMSFVMAARDVSTVALLSSSGTQPLSLLQLGYMAGGRYEEAAVVGVLLVLLTTGVALVARMIGARSGLRVDSRVS